MRHERSEAVRVDIEIQTQVQHISMTQSYVTNHFVQQVHEVEVHDATIRQLVVWVQVIAQLRASTGKQWR